MAAFAHLHVHSDFSFMDGACRLEDLVDRAVELGMSAVALTDHQGLYGAVRFYKKAMKAGIKPVVGAEVVVETAGISKEECDEPPSARLRLPAPVGFGRARGHGFHLTLLAKDLAGYRNLCLLISRSHVMTHEEPSIVTLRDLERHSEGLIALSGCPNGEVGAAVSAGLKRRAETAARRLASLFAEGDFYVELMHALTPDSSRYVAGLVDLARHLGLPYVATNDVHYVRPEGFRIHDVMAAAGALMPLPGPYERPNGELWLKPAGAMRELFRGLPEACDATLEIAERCELDLGLGTFRFPDIEVPRGETAYSVLSKAAWRGLEERYRPMTPEAVRRLQHELGVIQGLGFPEYFLIVKDIVDFAKGEGIRCSGRGSAGDSIVSYALGITDADPIAYDLLFERFLNPQRRQMPDIDVDFCSKRRDEVIEYIYKRFGNEHVAMVATVQTMSVKGAVRTAARALGHTPDGIDALSRGLPWVSSMPVREVLERYPECRGHLLADERRFGMLLDLSDELRKRPMHLGTHLGGFIITKDPVATWTPLQWAAKGVVVSQYDKDDVEALGLVKMDILGLRIHSAIDGTLKMARARLGPDAVPEPFTLPKDDPAVYETIRAADTVGMFQLESSGQRNLARRLQQRDFEDVIAAISLFRPGPVQADMVNPFVRRRHGIEPVAVPHPAMGKVLHDTYGIVVYQEQVLSVAKEVAGFDLAEADSLRRAMTHDRSPGEMAAIRVHFIERALARGVERAAAEEVFRQLEGFAAYGFNKAHAACFAVISYATAWLKTYFPAEFAAAILENEPMGFYSPRLVLDDARRHGIDARAPHVNSSAESFTVEDEGRAIRVGLSGLLHMTENTCGRLVRERRVRSFRDLADVLRRARPDVQEAESLIRVGALDGLGLTEAGRPPTRDEMLALLPELKAVLAKEGSTTDDVLLIAPARAGEPEDASHVSGWPVARRLSEEMRHLGLAIACHPLELAAAELERRGVVWSRDLPRCQDRARVRVAGLRERALTPPTRSGKRTCFLTLEDPTGLLDVVVFSDALERFGKTIVRHRAYVVDGVLQNNAERGLALVADRIEPLVVRTSGGSRVALSRGVGLGPLGPARPNLGAPEDADGEPDVPEAFAKEAR